MATVSGRLHLDFQGRSKARVADPTAGMALHSSSGMSERSLCEIIPHRLGPLDLTDIIMGACGGSGWAPENVQWRFLQPD